MPAGGRPSYGTAPPRPGAPASGWHRPRSGRNSHRPLSTMAPHPNSTAQRHSCGAPALRRPRLGRRHQGAGAPASGWHRPRSGRNSHRSLSRMAPHPNSTAQRHPDGRTASRRPRWAGCHAADEFVSFAACGRRCRPEAGAPTVPPPLPRRSYSPSHRPAHRRLRRRGFGRRNPSFPPLPRYGRRSQPISTCDICTFQLPRRRSPFGAPAANPEEPDPATIRGSGFPVSQHSGNTWTGAAASPRVPPAPPDALPDTAATPARPPHPPAS